MILPPDNLPYTSGNSNTDFGSNGMQSPPLRIELPLSVKITCVLFSLIMLGYLLWAGSGMLAPLAASMLISLLLVPLNRRLEGWGVNRTIAIFLCILLVVIILAGIVTFFSYQILSFQEQIPAIQKRAMELMAEFQKFVDARFHLSAAEQLQYINKNTDSMIGSGSALLTQVAGFGGDLFTNLALMPIYIFFMLYYRNFFAQFIGMLFPNKVKDKVRQVLIQIETVSQYYLIGLLSVIVIVAVLNTGGLMLLGIENAIFFGVLGSILCVIPYVGIAIASILPAIVTLVTKDNPLYALGVILIMMFVQFLEGNFITPNIVGSRVSVNPFAAVIALLLGGTLWGAAGMILAIPFIAIIKVIFDNVDALKPFGFIIGEPPNSVTEKTNKERERIADAYHSTPRVEVMGNEQSNQFEV
jgi:predicted PurR-regulated permease PerM